MKFYHLMALLLLSGCKAPEQSVNQETRECVEYRLMMTAPIPPDVMKSLENKCRASSRQ